MIILNWNIRDLGDVEKRAEVRNFLYLFGIDVVALQESKLFYPKFHLLQSIGKTWINEWVVLDSIGP